MACYHPNYPWVASGGGVTFTRSQALSGRRIRLACGQCYGCRLENSRRWAIRAIHEKETTKEQKSCFVTLTYRDRSLPPRGSLEITDWQKFAHRLRKTLGPFRYLHCGEYGDKRGRAHLHAIIYGHDFEEDRKFLKLNDQGDELYSSQMLNHIWGHGEQNPIGRVTFKSAAYVARYIMKKVNGQRADLMRTVTHYGQVVDTTTGEVKHYRKPEYATMSLKPGLGYDWIMSHMDQVYPSDELAINGHLVTPPPYYDRQYERVNPEGYAILKARRVKKAMQHADNNTTDRLEAREEIALRRNHTHERRSY